MGRRARYLLTDLQVRKARAKAKPYRLSDGAGLFLWMPPSGVAAWQFRYRLDGRAQTATLGKLEDVTLAEAREKAQEARALAREGRHVTTEQRVAKARRIALTAGTFGSIAERWVERQARRKRWTADYRQEIEASLENHLSKLNALPIAEITASLTAPIVERIERRAPDMARKVEQRLQAIMDYGVRRGLLIANPLPRPEPQRKANRTHLPAVLDRKAVGAILRDAERAEMSRGVRRAHLLAAFLAQRIGEIVPAEWREVDLEVGVWSIPRSRMKRKDAERGPHLVPLPTKLLAMMKEWHRADGDGARYVCPAPTRGGPVTREAIEKLYRRGLELSGKHSPHSWRSVLSSWANDAGKDREAVEAQLDHVVGNKVAAAYDRAKRLELRRHLMRWYESALLAARDGADVVSLTRAKR